MYVCEDRKVDDLQFAVEETSIDKGDLEVTIFLYVFMSLRNVF